MDSDRQIQFDTDDVIGDVLDRFDGGEAEDWPEIEDPEDWDR